MHTINVMIETPKGSKYKYKFDPDTNRLKVHKLLPAGLAFPYDFGFIPHTEAEDGDPLDVMIFSEDSFLPGSMVECKVMGAIKAKQTKNGKNVRNDRILATPVLSVEKEKNTSLEDLSKEKIKEIEDFFIYYNKMDGKEFNPSGILTASETRKMISNSEIV
jgi:inorganic pyrophosphatase